MKRYGVWFQKDGQTLKFQGFETIIAAIFCGLMLASTANFPWGIFDSIENVWVIPQDHLRPFVV